MTWTEAAFWAFLMTTAMNLELCELLVLTVALNVVEVFGRKTK